jgi:hypothetical protein
VAPRARSKQEFLHALRMGQGRVRGETGGVWKLMRDVLSIGRSMAIENPWTAPVAALGIAVPVIILGNYILESVFRALVDGALSPAAGSEGSRPRRHTHRGGGRVTFSGERCGLTLPFAITG